MELEVKTLDGAVAGTVALSDEIFGLEPRADILQRVVRWQLAKRQAGTHKAQGRSDVTRTGKKMYRQKGTGGARHGNKAAPQFRGGGKAFGPVVHSHAFDLPKKVRALGLKLALSAKVKDASLVILSEAVIADHKTKTLFFDVLAGNVVPHVELGPVRYGEHTEMFARCDARVVQVP